MPELYSSPFHTMAFSFTNGVFTPEQDNDKTARQMLNLCIYGAVHTRSDMSGVKGIIGMHRFDQFPHGSVFFYF